MSEENMKLKKFVAPALLFGVFVIYTLVIKSVDVKAIGPMGSSVGFASINSFFAGIFKYNEIFYTITKIVALFSFIYVGAFALLGLVSLIRKKSFAKVDFAIYAMGITYVITVLFYLLFEILVINFRPVLDEGELEASYPSSHTMLAISVFGSAAVYVLYRIKDKTLKMITVTMSIAFALVMTIGRLISGVHWFTDILGGVLLGCALVSLYLAFVQCIENRDQR